ncbi:MAG TPA: hypothetical protein PKO06_17935, partial [Candidatus Ozemobacteraceae bacterium]|nr:hypothetical protein [Candidatus Ozemobacteraceae bacterium]
PTTPQPTTPATSAAPTPSSANPKLDELVRKIDTLIENLNPPTDPAPALSLVLQLAMEFQRSDLAAEKRNKLFDRYFGQAQSLMSKDRDRAAAVLRQCRAIAPERPEPAFALLDLQESGAVRTMSTDASTATAASPAAAKARAAVEKLLKDGKPKKLAEISKHLADLEKAGDAAGADVLRKLAIGNLRDRISSSTSVGEMQSLIPVCRSLIPEGTDERKTFDTESETAVRDRKTKSIEETKKLVDNLEPPGNPKALAARIRGLKEIGEAELAKTLTKSVKKSFMASIATAQADSPAKALSLVRSLQLFDGMKQDAEVTKLANALAVKVPEKATGTNTGTTSGDDDAATTDTATTEDVALGADDDGEPVMTAPLGKTKKGKKAASGKPAKAASDGEGEDTADGGSDDALIAELEQLISPDKIEDSIDAMLAAIKKLEKAGRKSEASEYRQRGAVVLQEIADENAANGDKDRARVAYNKALKLSPGNKSVLAALEFVKE